MATTKAKSSASKTKLSALKNLVLNVAKGAAATKKQAAQVAAANIKGAPKPAPSRLAKSGQVQVHASKAPVAGASAKEKDKDKSAKASKSTIPQIKGGKAAPAVAVEPALAAKGKAPAAAKGRGRINKGAPATSLGIGVFASAVAARLPHASDTICREVACESLSTTGGYCRLHYIKNWKKIQSKALILREKKLNHYIEELVAKYPDKYIEAIRQDLADDNAFAKVIYDLDLDENTEEFEGGDAESGEQVIDSIKREFDDDADTF